MSIIHDFSDPRSFYPNNLSGYCLDGGESDTFFQGELSPEIWTLTNSLVATSFGSLAIFIMLIGCVISSLVCGVATRKKVLNSWLGVIYVFDLVIILVLISLYTFVHLYTIAQGNWTFGGDTNCERQNVCTAVASVIASLIIIKQYALLCLPFCSNFFVFGNRLSKRRCVLSNVSYIIISLYLVFFLLTTYFNQDLAFCVWSLPGMIGILALMYISKLRFVWLSFRLFTSDHDRMVTLPPIRTLKEFPTDKTIIKPELIKSRRLFFSTELVFLLVELVLCLILLVPAYHVELNVSVLTMVLFLLWLVWSCVIGPLKTVIHTPMQRKVIKKLYFQIKKVFSCRKPKQVDLSHELLIIENRTIIYHLKLNLAAVEKLIETGNTGIKFQDQLDHNKLKTPLILSSQHGHTNLVKTLLQAGAEVDQVVKGDLTTALEYACFYGHDNVVKVLLKNGSKPNGIDKNGKATGIPLAEAVKQHHGNIVKMLLLHGADPNMVDCCLGLSPMKWVTEEFQWYIQRRPSFRKDSLYICELLVKAGARLPTINIAHLRVLSFYTRKSVVIIGNSQHDKTTLVASLRNESRCLKKLVNRIKKMKIISDRTAGIDTVPFDSKKYGRVLFFDFAGQEAYHGPHQAFLRALLPRPGVSLSFLMLVKSTDPESTILSQLKRWLQPLISIPNVPENAKVKVILVGSFADQLTVAKSEVLTTLQSCLDQIEGIDQNWLEFGKPCVLDCRYSDSAGIDYLRDQINSVTSYEQSSNETGYNLHWVVASMKESFKQLGAAFQVKKFQQWTLEKPNDLPVNLPSADQICRDLAAAGHALYFPNEEDPDESWLVFDIPTVLNEIYGKLFSHFINNENSQTKYGLINRHDLHSLIPNYEINLICNLLIYLEFCLNVDKHLLKEVELLVNTANGAQNEWLFFPSLTKHQKPDQVFSIDQKFKVYICWQVHTKNNQTLSPIVHQTILLRLAAHQVFKHEISSTKVGHCILWCNGIMWSTIEGIQVAVQIADQSLLQVACRGLCEAERVLDYLSQIAQDILRTCSSFNTEVAAFIIHHPDMPAVSNDPKLASKKNMYPASSICTSRKEKGEYILSLPHEEDHVPSPVAMSDVFGCIPQLEVLQQLSTLGAASDPISRGQHMHTIKLCR